MFLPFPDSANFRQLPPSSGGIRFGPHLVRVDDGNMSGGHDDDTGGAYLETNRPWAKFVAKIGRF